MKGTRNARNIGTSSEKVVGIVAPQTNKFQSLSLVEPKIYLSEQHQDEEVVI